MNLPSGENSGPSSRPLLFVMFSSVPDPSDGDRVDVELAVAAAGVDQPLAVGRPAVQVRRRQRRDALRRTATGGHGVDRGLAGALVADAEHRAVERQHVIVVVAIGRAGVDRRPAAAWRDRSGTACRGCRRGRCRCRSARGRPGSSSALRTAARSGESPGGVRSARRATRARCRCSRDTARSRPSPDG